MGGGEVFFFFLQKYIISQSVEKNRYFCEVIRESMKKLDWFILKSYLGPLVMTFFIAVFILLLQFLWKYIDDLVGKGLEWYI